MAYRLASDDRLARLAAAGSEGALAAIFERHHQALHRYCHSIVGNGHDAADALQNTMLKALRALPGETRQIALRPWLYRIAHNESISLLRARRPDCGLDDAAEISVPAAGDAAESRERLRCLTEDLGELTEQQRGALLMRELGGLEFTEVAGALGITAPAVKQSVYEARCTLHALEEGREMDCETVRRTLSDGDRRMLRGKRMRGHLRSCAPCRGFQAAMCERPAQLAALAPPLPLAAAAAMLQHILGGGGGAAGGGGLLAGLAGTTKAATTLSLGAKVAAVAAVGGTLTGGAVYVAPDREATGPQRSTLASPPMPAEGPTAAAPLTATAIAERGRSRRPGPGLDAGAADRTDDAAARSAEQQRQRLSERGVPSPADRREGTGRSDRGDRAAAQRRRHNADAQRDAARRDGGARPWPDQSAQPPAARRPPAPQSPPTTPPSAPAPPAGASPAGPPASVSGLIPTSPGGDIAATAPLPQR